MPDALRESQKFFGDKADAYRQSKTHGNRADLDRMLALVRPRAGERPAELEARPHEPLRGLVALDVATGGGHTARALAEAGATAIALDATRSMLVGLGLPSIVCDAQRLPIAPSSVGIVASRIAPHHFPDLAAFVREAARVLS